MSGRRYPIYNQDTCSRMYRAYREAHLASIWLTPVRVKTRKLKASWTIETLEDWKMET